MTTWHKNLKKRFNNFDLFQHILLICNELNRAGNLIDDRNEYNACIERALELMDFSIQSGKWKGKLKEILRARDQIAEYYISIPKNTENLQKMLILLNSKSYKAMSMDKI